MNKKLLTLIFLIALSSQTWANEGMWIPSLLKKYNIEEMQQMGFKLTAEDVYDVNHSSMKDAVVLFGRGCTGEMVSDQGLLLTNHHCGYGQIQAHSSIEHDYLTNGFWAKNNSEELANPGLEVRFLDRMDDVSTSVFAGTESLSLKEKEDKIKENIKKLEADAEKDQFTDAVVKPLFKGNQYFIYVYKVFKDVRLVGTPPSAIGKFGGDTDNWMWPRHTGDFSVFRVYADKDNKPAEYSADNVPYHPKSHFPISLKGIQSQDFVMVFGFPGSTDEYLSSDAVSLLMNQTNPTRVSIRTKKLAIMKQHMDKDVAVRIKYSAKYASTANGWKKWQGEVNGLKRLDAIKKKVSFEHNFSQWASQNANSYTHVLPELSKLYKELTPLSNAYYYYLETWYYGTDVMKLARTITSSTKNISSMSPKDITGVKKKLQEAAEAHFKDYDQSTDEDIFLALMHMLNNNLDAQYLSAYFMSIMNKYDDLNLRNKVYRKSILSDQKELNQWIAKLSSKSNINKDPLLKLSNELLSAFNEIKAPYANLMLQIKAQEKEYMAGIMAMNNGKRLYPDANNLTMRVAYGKVEGYKPADGVNYQYYTTLDGIIEKDNPEIYDYDVPQRLHELYETKDYGQYARKDGNLPVAFIASIHTTGGNSGSPAINANGELIGINFDRCWEGTMSDIMFDPNMCRNIMVDIRYVLFTIDKFANAGYLLDEMTINK